MDNRETVPGYKVYVDPRTGERNYERREVGHLLDAELDGPMWTYVGSPQGRRRLARARAAGTAVVSRGYLDGVRAGFAALGLLGEYEASTDPAGLPVVPLLRRDVGA